MQRWFRFNGETHAERAGGGRAECGKHPLEMPPVEELGDDVIPDGACRRCVIAIGERWAEVEPIEDALARGYYEAELPTEDLPARQRQ